MKTGYFKNEYAVMVVFLMTVPAFSEIATAATVYTYTSFDLLDQTYAAMSQNPVTGINDSGQIVGFYADAGRTRSFILSGGVYTTLEGPPPGAGEIWDMWAQDINNNGDIVGWYSSGETGIHGFKYSNGSYSAITVPGADGTLAEGSTVAYGISNNGSVAGVASSWYWPDTTRGYIESGGVYTVIDDPSSSSDQVNYVMDINNSGQIAGSYHSAYVRSSDGVYTALPAGEYRGPVLTPSNAIGINDSGLVLVYFNDGCATAVFDGSEYAPIVHPDARGSSTAMTCSTGINDLGQVVGTYYDGTQHRGFIATPSVPEPGSLLLLVSGLIGLAWRQKGK